MKDLIDNLEFDTIYHEHLSYFSVTAAKWLFERHGLSLITSVISRSTAEASGLRSDGERTSQMPSGPCSSKTGPRV